MSTVDAVYTPIEVALALRSSVTKRKPRLIADFTAGDGALLRLAAERWPDCEIIANDLDCKATLRLRRRYPNWRVSTCDFLNDDSLSRSRSLNKARGNCSLVLLNPPFSYRGWQSWSVRFGGEDVSCSRSMAFILRGIEMLVRGGQLAAVIPAGSLTSQKDEQAWAQVRETCDVDVVAEYDKRTFAGYYPRTVLVRITRDLRMKRADDQTGRVAVLVEPQRDSLLTVVRGWIPMHTLGRPRSGEVLPLIHSKDLGRGGAPFREGRVRSPVAVQGPGVLMPRVGQPSPDNLSIIYGDTKVALSDCVIALLTATAAEAVMLHQSLVRCWPQIEACFGGTCARYITLQKLGIALKGCGFSKVEFCTPDKLMRLQDLATLSA